MQEFSRCGKASAQPAGGKTYITTVALLTRAAVVARTFTVVIGSVSRAKKGLFPTEWLEFLQEYKRLPQKMHKYL